VKKRKSIKQLWHDHPSGLLTPGGTHSDISSYSSETYLHVKEKAQAVERLYFDSGVPLPRTCDLTRLIADAKSLSDSWLLNATEKITMTLQFRVFHLSRIADALLNLKEIPERAKYLKDLTSGNLDLFQRKKSRAKDILWELELWTVFRASGLTSILDEPEIVVNYGESRLAVACKKLYSTKNVEKVLSEAVAQIEPNFEFGIVALNIDDLVPANQLLQTPTHESADNFVTELNNSFLRKHERHFRKYLASGRILSALISTAVVADIHRASPRLNNVRRSTIWTIPGLPPDKKTLLRYVYDHLMC
jgi:hypothetical protein